MAKKQKLFKRKVKSKRKICGHCVFYDMWEGTCVNVHSDISFVHSYVTNIFDRTACDLYEFDSDNWSDENAPELSDDQ